MNTGDRPLNSPFFIDPQTLSIEIQKTISTMMNNLETPLTTDDLARSVGMSRKQLELLFKHHFYVVPSRFYTRLRLDHAKTLLRLTGKSVVQIGLSCGFASGPQFSATYRIHFGIGPREERFLHEQTKEIKKRSSREISDPVLTALA
ncbi:helix-turn-helix domain-containing protein [Paraburkholderia polaris]|nr:helix-turn-helix domain-containing protein [Paraburkholderia polaris]